MTENRRRWYVALCLVGGGAAYFLIRVLSGVAVDVAAVSAAFYVVALGAMFVVLSRKRRKTLRKLSERGQVECYIRRPEGPRGDRYRKWNIGLVTPAPGLLIFQPVLGRTSIARGEPFEICIQASGGPRYPATRWDKFNRLEPHAIVWPLQTDEGPLEVAGQSATLDKLQASLEGASPTDARS
jgi:hypothetical protein